MRVTVAATLTLAVVLPLAACSAPEPTEVPAVVGERLSDAYDDLEDAGFEVEADDRVESRMIMDRDNWVVVDQSPKGGTTTDHRADVELGVAKLDDPGTAQMIPADSPVMPQVLAHEAEAATEAQEERAREEERAAEEAAEAAAEAQQTQGDLVAYVEQVDPAMLLAKDVIVSMDEFADIVRNGSYTDTEFMLAGDLLDDTMGQLGDSMEGAGPPGSTGRVEAYETLQTAAEDFSRAARTLLSANGSAREESLARYDQIWAEAVASWNDGLTRLYDGTGIAPPLVQP